MFSNIIDRYFFFVRHAAFPCFVKKATIFQKKNCNRLQFLKKLLYSFYKKHFYCFLMLLRTDFAYCCMKSKSVNSSLTALLILLFTTIAADQLFFFSSRYYSISYVKSFPDCISADDAKNLIGTNAVFIIHKKIFTTIQLPK